MKYEIRELRRAQADILQIAEWLVARFPRGATAWLDAYDELVSRLSESANGFAEAMECVDCYHDLNERGIFSTRFDYHATLLHLFGLDHQELIFERSTRLQRSTAVT